MSIDQIVNLTTMDIEDLHVFVGVNLTHHRHEVFLFRTHHGTTDVKGETPIHRMLRGVSCERLGHFRITTRNIVPSPL